MLSKFNALQIELSTFEQPDTKEACQDAIISHTSTKQRVFTMNIEILIAEDKHLLKNLISGGLLRRFFSGNFHKTDQKELYN